MGGQTGRIKKGGEREPNGRLLRTKQEVIPMGAMMQRVKRLGISGPVSPVAAAMLCRDQEAGTALGRLMWDYQADGTRVRRMMADGETPVITDAMKAGADVIRASWAAWSRASGLPCRNPRAIGLGAVAGGGAGLVTAGQEQAAADRWQAVTAALMGCEAPLLVWRVIEAVVIDNEATPLLVERSAALSALRRGLQAVGEKTTL
jgi:hypothetical protein